MDDQEGEKDRRARELYENHLDMDLSSGKKEQQNYPANDHPYPTVVHAQTPTPQSYEQPLVKKSNNSFQQETISSVLPPNSFMA